MRAICATCAIVFVALPGCFLSHARDAAVADAATFDATGADAGTVAPTDCTGFWTTLPSCPASTDTAVGTPCAREGTRCGFECCEPGPPIECAGGRWQPLDFAPDCSAVRCAAPTPCGFGACSAPRVCVVPEGPRGGDSADLAFCALPPSPIDSCDAAPPGAIVAEPRACMMCTCADVGGAVQIALSCACC
jgi:hypothetical protein